MLEIMQFYVSGFWVWLGLTTGLYLGVACVISACVGIASWADGRKGRKQ